MNHFEKELLKFYTPEQFARIQSVKIGIAGAGGLGSNLAVALVRSGFKNFEILDQDIIELSNLNRQYYFLDEVGKSKVVVLKERLLKINPDLKINIINDQLVKANASKYFQHAGILFEAFDNVESKKLILEEYGNSDKIIIFGNGMVGISNKNEFKIKKLNDKHYLVGDGIADVRAGDKPFAPRVATCAGLMASVVLELVCQR